MEKKWTNIEINLLKEFFINTNDVNIINYITGRTLTSIKVKAKRLKIYRNDITKKSNRSNSNIGEKNGMYGKHSKIKNKTYDGYYGIEKSDLIKTKLSLNKIGKSGLSGSKNGMYGKIPHNKGILANNIVREKIRNGIMRYWNNLSEIEFNRRKNKLREEWILKRNNYSEIDTLPEKITENILLKLKIEYIKKMNIGYYNCDFVVNNTIIEVQGDYWHGNPKFYKTFDKIQQKNINRDKRKLSFLFNKGYTIIYLWENELKTNLKYCEEKLKNYLHG
jgi:G:T-mismatch repair DNA endonuclease (very short patch repair protein)